MYNNLVTNTFVPHVLLYEWKGLMPISVSSLQRGARSLCFPHHISMSLLCVEGWRQPAHTISLYLNMESPSFGVFCNVFIFSVLCPCGEVPLMSYNNS